MAGLLNVCREQGGRYQCGTPANLAAEPANRTAVFQQRPFGAASSRGQHPAAALRRTATCGTTATADEYDLTCQRCPQPIPHSQCNAPGGQSGGTWLLP